MCYIVLNLRKVAKGEYMKTLSMSTFLILIAMVGLLGCNSKPDKMKHTLSDEFINLPNQPKAGMKFQNNGKWYVMVSSYVAMEDE